MSHFKVLLLNVAEDSDEGHKKPIVIVGITIQLFFTSWSGDTGFEPRASYSCHSASTV